MADARPPGYVGPALGRRCGEQARSRRRVGGCSATASLSYERHCDAQARQLELSAAGGAPTLRACAPPRAPPGRRVGVAHDDMKQLRELISAEPGARRLLAAHAQSSLGTGAAYVALLVIAY